MQREKPGSRDFYEGIIAIVSEKKSIHQICTTFPRSKSELNNGYDLYNKSSIVAYLRAVMRWHLSDWTIATIVEKIAEVQKSGSINGILSFMEYTK